ncbi:Transducin beta-like protein 2, partial [Quaeritorhiza haematococci]
NLDDYPTSVGVSPDGHRLVVALQNSSTLRAFQAEKADGKPGAVTYRAVSGPTFAKMHDADVHSMGVGSTGVVMSCSGGPLSISTILGSLFSLASMQLSPALCLLKLTDNGFRSFSLWHMTVFFVAVNNYMARMSPDAKFIALGAFTSDVKIWEIKYDRATSQPKSVDRAMELKGHSRGVTALDFGGPDSKRVATVSRDDTFRLWNIDVRYHLSEDARVLHTVPRPSEFSKPMDLISLSPDAKFAAVTCGSDFIVWNWAEGKRVAYVEGAHLAALHGVLQAT